MIERAVSLISTQGLKGTSEILRARSSIVESIIEYAALKERDLLAVRTRGQGSFRKLLKRCR